MPSTRHETTPALNNTGTGVVWLVTARPRKTIAPIEPMVMMTGAGCNVRIRCARVRGGSSASSPSCSTSSRPASARGSGETYRGRAGAKVGEATGREAGPAAYGATLGGVVVCVVVVAGAAGGGA